MRSWPVLAFLALGCSASAPPPPPTPPPARPALLAGTTPPAPVAEQPAAPVDLGSCAGDGDCHFDDACVPRQCLARATPIVACEETGPSPGRCMCFAGRCTLRPHESRSPVTVDEACDDGEHRCGLELSFARCAPGIEPDRPASAPPTGPRCECDGNRRCHYWWVDPVACHSNDDCWVEQGPLRPAPRPQRLRGRRFRPCRDGESAPVCREGFCGLDGYDC